MSGKSQDKSQDRSGGIIKSPRQSFRILKRVARFFLYGTIALEITVLAWLVGLISIDIKHIVVAGVILLNIAIIYVLLSAYLLEYLATSFFFLAKQTRHNLDLISRRVGVMINEERKS